MARKLELRKVTAGDLNGGIPAVTLDYGEMYQQILQFGGAAGGLTLDEVIQAVAAREPIDQAIATGEPAVTLTDQQWQTLCRKLAEFRFGFAHKLIAEFGQHIREAPEIGTEPAAAEAERRVPRHAERVGP